VVDSRAAKTVEQHRKKNLERSKKDGAKIIQNWTERLHQKRLEEPVDGQHHDEDKFIMGSQGWSFNWALQSVYSRPSSPSSRSADASMLSSIVSVEGRTLLLRLSSREEIQ
jgi:hypothetical protein